SCRQHQYQRHLRRRQWSPTIGAMGAQPAWGVIADDLTGACGVAAQAVVSGLSTWVGLGPVPGPRPPITADCRVLDTATRDSAAASAAVAAARAQRWLLERRVESIALRIDSTLRGPIGVQLQALLIADPRPRLALVVAAAPRAGRACVAGRVTL